MFFGFIENVYLTLYGVQILHLYILLWLFKKTYSKTICKYWYTTYIDNSRLNGINWFWNMLMKAQVIRYPSANCLKIIWYFSWICEKLKLKKVYKRTGNKHIPRSIWTKNLILKAAKHIPLQKIAANIFFIINYTPKHWNFEYLCVCSKKST